MKVLYILYQLFIALPILLVLTILTAIVTIIGSWIGNPHFWGYYPGKIWSQLFCYVLLIPVKVVGHPEVLKKTSYVFVANHQGSFDIFLIYGFLGRNFKWMMKKSLRKMPFVGKACEAAGHIFVDKSGPKKVIETIEHARHVLQDGTSLVVFPEGARTFTGHMGYFKKGAFQLADDLQLPVVPLTIIGSFNILPRTGGFVSWHPMTLVVHKPIYPQSQGMENIKATMEEAYREIEKDLPEKYQGVVFKSVRSLLYNFLNQGSHDRIRKIAAQHNENTRSQYIIIILLDKLLSQCIHFSSQFLTFSRYLTLNFIRCFSIHNHTALLTLQLVCSVIQRSLFSHKIIQTIIQRSSGNYNTGIINTDGYFPFFNDKRHDTLIIHIQGCH